MVPYPKFVRFVKQVFSLTVRRTRLENLHLLTYGLLQGRSCCLSRIARFFPLPTEHTHRLRRLWRFLTNPHFIPEQVYPQLIRALSPRWPAQLPMPLAVDWTRAGGYELLVAALPWRGRALPVWAAVCAGSWQGIHTSRNHLEHAFIAAVTSALRAVRPQMRLVWIADRGFARLSLFQFLASLGVDFCIRVNAKTKIAWRGRNLLLSELAVKPGQTLWLEGVSYRPQGRPFERGGIRVNLLVAWKRPTHRGTLQAPQPWYVVTSLESPQQALAYYRRRDAHRGGLSGLEAAAGAEAGRGEHRGADGAPGGGVSAGDAGLGLAGVVWAARGISSGSVGAGEGELVLAGLAAGGAGQAAGAPQGAETRSTRRRVAMIQKVERRQALLLRSFCWWRPDLFAVWRGSCQGRGELC
jgi:hypothetical protein